MSARLIYPSAFVFFCMTVAVNRPLVDNTQCDGTVSDACCQTYGGNDCLTLPLALLQCLKQTRSVQERPAYRGIILIAGITGDLSKRKIVPALYELVKEGMDGLIVGIGRSETAVSDLLDKVRPFIPHVDEAVWKRFTSMIRYYQNDGSPDSFQKLKKVVEDAEKEAKLDGQRIAYLAIPADAFSASTRNLVDAGILVPHNNKHRIAYEKPFGWDLASAQQIYDEVRALLAPNQFYIIDHYLAKKLVELMFCVHQQKTGQPWKRCIKEIRVFFDEKIGLEGRGAFYDRYGVIKDVVQNHVLQLLSLFFLDGFSSADFPREKATFIDSLTLVDGLRGQYAGYQQEKDVKSDSATETFVALELRSHLDAWKHVPVWIRAGKMLHRKSTEIQLMYGTHYPCVITLRVSPREEIVLDMPLSRSALLGKVHITIPLPTDEPYKVLLTDIMRGKRNSTVTFPEVLAQWRFAAQIAQASLPLIAYQQSVTRSFGRLVLEK